MSKARKLKKRLLLSHEVRDNNYLFSLQRVCDCDCHKPGVYVMHFMECCNPSFHRIELGEKTTMSEEEFSKFVDWGIKLFRKEIEEDSRNRRIIYWRRAINNTKLSQPNLDITDEMVEKYAEYIRSDIELTECIESILKMLD